MHQYDNDLADHMREYKSTKWIAVLLDLNNSDTIIQIANGIL